MSALLTCAAGGRTLVIRVWAAIRPATGSIAHSLRIRLAGGLTRRLCAGLFGRDRRRTACTVTLRMVFHGMLHSVALRSVSGRRTSSTRHHKQHQRRRRDRQSSQHQRPIVTLPKGHTHLGLHSLPRDAADGRRRRLEIDENEMQIR
jgi:hypothetical protein